MNSERTRRGESLYVVGMVRAYGVFRHRLDLRSCGEDIHSRPGCSREME